MKEREHRLLFQVFIATGLLLMGIYHIGLYIFRSDKSILFFGLAGIALFLRMVFVSDILAVQVFPEFPWEWAVKIEYLSVFFGISFFVLFFYYLYFGNVSKVVSHGLAYTMISVSLPIFFLPAKIYTEWMIFYQCLLIILVLYIVYLLIRVSLKGLPGAKMNLAAGFVFLATVVNDILYYNFLWESIDLVTLGLFMFIFTQMFMLAKKFASAYQEVEILKNELEETNQNLEAIVDNRTKALRLANEKLIKEEKARKNLLSNIAHELGNPLTSVIGYLTALKDGVSGNSSERHIQIAHQKALKLQRITDDLRQLVKLEQDELIYNFQLMKIREIYGELKVVYDWQMINRKVQFNFDIPDYVINVDIDRIEQVFTNIVKNALIRTKQCDEITIQGRLFKFANAYVISIKDTGIGIKKEDQKQLFDRYFRVKNIENETHSGTGLGLTISREIIEAHRGRIGVRSEYGIGSTFYFILPVDKEQ